MRFWNCIPLSLLVLTVFTTASQVSWKSHSTAQSDTLLDVLNRDEDYTLLLSLLQRARLIPTLNKFNSSTFFAPTNDAVKRRADKSTLWQSLLYETRTFVPDNVQEQLRQQLFYHLLNYSLYELPEDSSMQTLKTLLFPHSPTDSPPNEPPSSPWFPIPHGLLGDQPQRLRLTSRDGSTWVGVNTFGNGGSKLVKEKVEATNGIVYGIADVLEPPPDIMTVVGGLKSLSYFQKVLTPEIERFLNSTPELTLFMPLDSAWESLDPLERLYLESDFAADDLRGILDMHVVAEPGVRWSESFESSTESSTIISGAKLVHPDVYAGNGVLHLVSSLLVPQGALQLTPEKYLLALNCTSFVSLLHSVNLEHLINNTDNQYTILAPRDDVLSLSAYALPEAGSPDLKRALEYHFLPGLWKPNKLEDEMLLETELRELGLDDGRQVIHIDVHDGEKTDVQPRHITFGGAGMIGEHVEINNTVIYFISRPLDPPVDPLQTALPSLDLSSFLAAVFSTSLADVIKRMPRTTFLIPRNSAFKRLGLLVSDHLLAASSKQDLENIILHHIIDNVEYSKNLVKGSQRTFATLEGSDLQLERTEDEAVVISASGGWAGMKSALFPQNMLTNTGVIHEVSDLMIPRSVELNVGKLMKAAKATTMTNVMTKAGFDWILDGTPPPEGSEWAEGGLGGNTWTLLCPTDDAFKKYNLTQLLEDVDRTTCNFSMKDILNNNRPLPLDQLGSYLTLLSPSSTYGDIVFKELDDKTAAGYMVGIKNARGTDGKADWARVLSWGRTTTGSGTGGVVQIDQLLVPYHPSWWIEYGPPSFVGVVGVVLICLFFYGVHVFWNRESTEATYEPVGGFGRDCDDS
ncbi:FAS1 domain-containing protein [Chiua virens]|nr:FAS1 domain-containing protein [Chiua virens]